MLTIFVSFVRLFHIIEQRLEWQAVYQKIYVTVGAGLRVIQIYSATGSYAISGSLFTKSEKNTYRRRKNRLCVSGSESLFIHCQAAESNSVKDG